MPTKKAVRMIERAVTRMGRSMGPRSIGRTTEKTLKKLVSVSHLAVIDCLDEYEHDETKVTIGMIARRVGVDPSRASRMVRNAVKAGYVERVISQDDARQTYVVLTAKGKKFAAGIRQVRRDHFLMRLQGWSEQDCETFAQLLTRFVRNEKSQKPTAAARAIKDLAEPSKGALVVLHPILNKLKRG